MQTEPTLYIWLGGVPALVSGPLFQPMDRQSMKWAFDLRSHTDDPVHAPGILAGLQYGSMPCGRA